MENTVGTFTYIEGERKKTQIDQFINTLFDKQSYEVQNVASEEVLQSISGREILRRIMEAIKEDFTIVTEEYHIDKSYRDTYYMYFSNIFLPFEQIVIY